MKKHHLHNIISVFFLFASLSTIVSLHLAYREIVNIEGSQLSAVSVLSLVTTAASPQTLAPISPNTVLTQADINEVLSTVNRLSDYDRQGSSLFMDTSKELSLQLFDNLHSILAAQKIKIDTTNPDVLKLSEYTKAVITNDERLSSYSNSYTKRLLKVHNAMVPHKNEVDVYGKSFPILNQILLDSTAELIPRFDRIAIKNKLIAKFSEKPADEYGKTRKIADIKEYIRQLNYRQYGGGASLSGGGRPLDTFDGVGKAEALLKQHDSQFVVEPPLVYPQFDVSAVPTNKATINPDGTVTFQSGVVEQVANKREIFCFFGQDEQYPNIGMLYVSDNRNTLWNIYNSATDGGGNQVTNAYIQISDPINGDSVWDNMSRTNFEIYPRGITGWALPFPFLAGQKVDAKITLLTGPLVGGRLTSPAPGTKEVKTISCSTTLPARDSVPLPTVSTISVATPTVMPTPTPKTVVSTATPKATPVPTTTPKPTATPVSTPKPLVPTATPKPIATPTPTPIVSASGLSCSVSPYPNTTNWVYLRISDATPTLGFTYKATNPKTGVFLGSALSSNNSSYYPRTIIATYNGAAKGGVVNATIQKVNNKTGAVVGQVNCPAYTL